MKVLVACEESQRVCIAFRNLGHEAYSCDIIDCSGNHPEWHIKDDVLNHLDNNWDLLIAHPPCTYLANSGVQHLHKDKSRWEKMEKAVNFFNTLLNVPIKKICIENPVPHGYAKLPKYSQIIQPYFFGDEVQKKTCLWLKGLPNLIPTNIVNKGETYIDKNGKSNGSKWYQLPPSKDRSKYRSKTFQGIANAMADQWGNIK